jgi:hypothetical protein
MPTLLGIPPRGMRVSDKFRIYKGEDPYFPWEVDFPDGFAEDADGRAVQTFDQAIQMFVKESKKRCPDCGKASLALMCGPCIQAAAMPDHNDGLPAQAYGLLRSGLDLAHNALRSLVR